MVYWCKKCKEPIFDSELHKCSCDGEIIKTEVTTLRVDARKNVSLSVYDD